MSLPFLHAVILSCINKINGERTIFSIYHFLNGKKSSQTIQDIHLFNLGEFFGTCKGLSRERFEKIVLNLEQEGFLIPLPGHSFRLSKKGESFIANFTDQYPFIKDLNGWKYQQTHIFWKRISLLIQVVSNLIHEEKQYLPVQKDKEIQEWVKNFLREEPYLPGEIGQNLYGELEACLVENKYVDPAVVVIRLTGYQSYGLTSMQASEALQMENSLYHYQFISFLHFIMEQVQLNRDVFPLLYTISQDLHEPEWLTATARQTYALLKKGYSLEEIASMRKLKINTIQDHIVELALNIQSFDITPYVERCKKQTILNAINQSESKQLKCIKKFVNDASYFEIRLVMARIGMKNG